MTRPRLVDLPTAAADLGVSVSWLEKAVAARAVQCTRVGRRVLFSDDDLDAFIRARRQPAMTGVSRLRRTA
jgi:excisionase family DNA binding protein